MAKFALKAEHLLATVPRHLLHLLPATPATPLAAGATRPDYFEQFRLAVKNPAAGSTDLVSPLENLFTMALQALQTPDSVTKETRDAALRAINPALQPHLTNDFRVSEDTWQEVLASAGHACLRLYWLRAELNCKMFRNGNRTAASGFIQVFLDAAKNECDALGFLLSDGNDLPTPFSLSSRVLTNAIVTGWSPAPPTAAVRDALREMARRVLRAEAGSQSTPASALQTQHTNFGNAVAQIRNQKPRLFLKEGRIGECFHHGAVAALFDASHSGGGTQNFLENLRQAAGESPADFQKRQNSQQRQREFLEAVRADYQPLKNQDGTGSPNDNSINLELLCPRFSQGAAAVHDQIYKAFVGGVTQASVGALRNWLQGVNELHGRATLGGGGTPPNRVMIFTRNADKETHKNMTAARLDSIVQAVAACGLNDVIICGDVGEGAQVPIDLKSVFRAGGPLRCYDLREFWRDNTFKAAAPSNSLGHQIVVHRLLYEEFNLWCLIGNRSGGMDGATLAGVPQICFDPKRTNHYEVYTDRIGFSGICSRSWNSMSTTRGSGTDSVHQGFRSGLNDGEVVEFQLALVKCATVRAEDLGQMTDNHRYSFGGPKRVL